MGGLPQEQLILSKCVYHKEKRINTRARTVNQLHRVEEEGAKVLIKDKNDPGSKYQQLIPWLMPHGHVPMSKSPILSGEVNHIPTVTLLTPSHQVKNQNQPNKNKRARV